MQRFGPTTILVTGGAGFIGSNFIRLLLAEHPQVKVVCVDALTYAGNPDNVKGLPKNRFTFIEADIVDRAKMDQIVKKYAPDFIINFAAESHVDRSIHGGAGEFIRTNVLGTAALLDAARTHLPNLKKFVQVSTDEVYGTLALGSKKRFTESSPLAPNSPYASSKAAADLVARSFFVTYGMPVVTTRCSNNYGPYQHPEKLIPFSISRLLAGKPVALYGDGKYVRDWIHVDDHARALILALLKGVPGEVYNVGADDEVDNLTLATKLVQYFKKGKDSIEFVKDRPGHDRRYAIDSSKVQKELGWKPKQTFAKAFPKTIEWYLGNAAWMKRAIARGANNTHI